MNYINLGERKWRGQWISKQDIIEYFRCAYRVYLAFSEGIPISEMKETTLLQRLLVNGLEFESDVIHDIQPIEARTKESIEPLKKERLTIQIPKVVRNHQLGIQGIPDLINTDNGQFVPIEIKNHKEVYYTDELELAFYWLLLDPLRKKKSKPRGYIILNNDEIVEIKITKAHLSEVMYLIEDVQDIELLDARPRITQECRLCKIEKKCREKVISSGGLTAIHNISITREKQFSSLGINNISDMMGINEERINPKLYKRFGNTPGTAELYRMKCHAHSFGERKPVFLGDDEIITKINSLPIFILDLEYDPVSVIWLIGIIVKTKKNIITKQYFAEKKTIEAERKLMESLIHVRRKYPDHLLVTYSGLSADLPQLKKACKRHRLYPTEYNLIVSNHLDLYQIIVNNFRFPISSMALSGIEKYLGIEKNTDIRDGFDALARYDRFLMTKKAEAKLEIKNELCRYNADDIESTLSVINNIPKFLKESIVI